MSPRRGRPRRNPAAPAKCHLTVRLTPDEQTALMAAASMAGESVSDYIRRAVAMRIGGTMGR